eukprot:TRINITY_DN11509_c0_g1_i1.p1 TRINITY_DN11509_c0_g1~~TRINITY_DN11509_c0_g1_i1.p1  ORF type:complete len:508 (+),score=95.29 TRINITY_DN11509_c0_g1_i1:63-1586(+)
MMILLWVLLGVVLLAGIAFYLIWRTADPTTIPVSYFKWYVKREDWKTIDQEKMDTKEKFLIVGAGFCGLGVGGALVRHGIPFDMVEADDHVGGNWYHGVYGTVHIISSRLTTEYKDFPMPTSYPDFPSSHQVLKYLKDYCAHYDLDRRISLKTEVEKVDPELDPNTKNHTGNWIVKFANNDQPRIYKGVIIATGHHWSRRMPNYPGQSEFTGKIIHSKDYKSPEIFQTYRHVLVVGGGNSACDISVEAARCTKNPSHVSHRRGYWFLPRTFMGVPLVELIYPWMPIWFQRFIIVTLYRILIGNNSKYGLQEPDHKVFQHHPTINSDLLNFIKLGRIIPHPDIKEFSGNVIKFVDGTQLPNEKDEQQKDNIDLVVFATGYNIDIPMVDKDILQPEDGVPQLIFGLIPRKHKNLYVFGTGQVRYGAGSMISLGADMLGDMIKVQQKVKRSMAEILMAMGVAKVSKRGQKSADVLVDPHALCLQVKQAKWMLSKMEFIEKVLVMFGRLKG